MIPINWIKIENFIFKIVYRFSGIIEITSSGMWLCVCLSLHATVISHFRMNLLTASWRFSATIRSTLPASPSGVTPPALCVDTYRRRSWSRIMFVLSAIHKRWVFILIASGMKSIFRFLPDFRYFASGKIPEIRWKPDFWNALIVISTQEFQVILVAQMCDKSLIRFCIVSVWGWESFYSNVSMFIPCGAVVSLLFSLVWDLEVVSLKSHGCYWRANQQSRDGWGARQLVNIDPDIQWNLQISVMDLQ